MISWMTWRMTPLCFPVSLTSDELCRFGGGTEMMRDGDVDGLWHLLEAGQKYISVVLFAIPIKQLIILYYRNAIFMSHVPWLGALFYRFPNFAKDLKAFRAHSKKQAMARKQRGSPHKDLFHHLVCANSSHWPKHSNSISTRLMRMAFLRIRRRSLRWLAMVINFYALRRPLMQTIQ